MIKLVGIIGLNTAGYVAPFDSLIRSCNILLVMIGNIIKFSRMSTMTEEHLNRHIRSGCGRDNSFQNIMTFMPKYNIGMQIIEELKIDPHKCRRDYQSGITLNFKVHKYSITFSKEEVECDAHYSLFPDFVILRQDSAKVA